MTEKTDNIATFFLNFEVLAPQASLHDSNKLEQYNVGS